MEDKIRDFSIEELDNQEKEILELQSEMREMFGIVSYNRDTLDECFEKTDGMFSKINDEVKRVKGYFLKLKRNNHHLNKSFKNQRLNHKRRTKVTKRSVTPSVSRRNAPKIVDKSLPVVSKRRKRILNKKKFISTPNTSKNRIIPNTTTPISRKRNYMITPVQSRRKRIKNRNRNKKSTRPKEKVVAEGRPEEPVYIDFRKLPEVGSMLADSSGRIHYMWSVSTSDIRRRKYFRSERFSLFDHEFVLKVITKGERGNRHISFYLEYIPKENEENGDVVIEIAVCMLNSIRGDLSFGFNSQNSFNKNNISFGWKFFSSKKKILRKAGGFVYDDKTVCFDFTVKEMIVQNEIIFSGDD